MGWVSSPCHKMFTCNIRGIVLRFAHSECRLGVCEVISEEEFTKALRVSGQYHLNDTPNINIRCHNYISKVQYSIVSSFTRDNSTEGWRNELNSLFNDKQDSQKNKMFTELLS